MLLLERERDSMIAEVEVLKDVAHSDREQNEIEYKRLKEHMANQQEVQMEEGGQQTANDPP